ncbi:MAG: lytic polysaccharide monooxygenase [Pseudomonadales bacterium]|nr:lytic polysaccharide monooxygenase [Pseudomonadales bacterium]
MKYKTSALMLAIATAYSGLSLAHGTMNYPINRTYQCYQEGPESPKSDACKAAKAVGGASPMYNWSAISQNAGGNDKAFVADGKLCSGGNQQYQGFDLARDDWPKTRINTSGKLSFSYYGSAPHATKRWTYYITKDSYDFSKPLQWSDLQQFCEFGSVTLNGSNRYNMDCQLPSGFNGDRIIYNVWERSDSTETFYSCSDVNISGLPGGSNGGGTSGNTQDDATDNNNGSDNNADDIQQQASAATLSSPASGSTISQSNVTFSITNNDASQTWLYLGSQPGEDDIFRSSVSGNQINVADIPLNGQTVYVTLWSYINNTWQTLAYQLNTVDADEDNNGNIDSGDNSAFYDLGALRADMDLTEGTVVTLRLMDGSYAGNNLRDLEEYSITIAGNMGNKNNWPYYLATEINANSQYIKAGFIAADGDVDSITPVKQAAANHIYSIVGEGLQFELETAFSSENNGDSNSDNNADNVYDNLIKLITSASQMTVLDSAKITISGAQSSGFDIQDATYQWSVESGSAEIVDANALETEVIFDQSEAGQIVTLKLAVTSNGETHEQLISIEHGSIDNNANTDSSTSITDNINDLIDSAEDVVNSYAKGSSGSTSFLTMLLLGLMAGSRRLFRK